MTGLLECPRLSLRLADEYGLEWCQNLVSTRHYSEEARASAGETARLYCTG